MHHLRDGERRRLELLRKEERLLQVYFAEFIQTIVKLEANAAFPLN